MNKSFILTPSLCILASSLFVSCFQAVSEEETAEEEGFQQIFHCVEFEQLPFETRSYEIKDLAGRLDFAVFDSDGTRVKSIGQEASAETFGTVSVRLPEGEYTIVAVAHNGEKKATLTTPAKITFDGNKVTDTFVYCKQIAVNDNQSYNLEMKRCVAMVRFVITDETPSEISTFRFYYTGGSSTLDATTGKGCVNSRQTELRSRKEANSAGETVYEIYTFPRADSQNLKLTISALNSTDETICEKVIDAVPVVVSQISQYTGPFFSGSSSLFDTNNTFYTNDTWTTNSYTL